MAANSAMPAAPLGHLPPGAKEGPPPPAPNGVDDGDGAESDSGMDDHAVPMQKRRRVTRACDECRRKKIKCDGRQPCTHCTVYSYDCTYDQPSHRRRNPAPMFVEQLEKKLKRAEAIVGLCFPNMRLDDGRFDAMLEKGSAPNTQDRPYSPSSTLGNGVKSESSSQTSPDPHNLRPVESNEHNLESMIHSTGTIDLDERGRFSYYGAASGLSFIKRLDEDLGEQPPDPRQGRKPDSPPSRLISDVMMRWPSPDRSHHHEARDSPSEHDHDIDELPSRKVARRLCHYALEDATAIISPVHLPSFYASFDRIFDRKSHNYEDQDHKFLPLLYTVMALGCLFANDNESDLERHGYERAADQGYKYFWHARQLVDITDCRDLTTLQAIVFMILFLQCSAKLSTCYAYIGVALRSAMKMGMHRSFRDHFSPIDLEIRKRLFWAIRKMDIFVSAFLGLPLTLSDEDIDQDYPAEVDDDYISSKGVKPMPAGRFANIAAANADFRLTAILVKLIRNIYPVKNVKGSERGAPNAYRVSYMVIKDIENDLQCWMEGLAPQLKPGGPGGDSPRIMRSRQLLRMAYAFVQMLLYRPFIHYVSPRCHAESVDPRSYACAEACISISRNIIHITADMKRNGLLAGSYWFIHYTTFFAVLSLVFYALENANVDAEMMQDAIEGRAVMAALAQRSMAADRCTATLTVLFEHFAEARRKDAQRTGIQHPTQGMTSQTPAAAPFQAPANVDPSSLPNPIFAVRSMDGAMPTVKSSLEPGNHRDGMMAMQNSQSPHFYSSSTSTPSSSGMASNPAFPNAGMQVPGHMTPSTRYPAYAGQQQPDLYMQDQDGMRNFDLSAMMFPSADPMAYPNQPMLTLEQSGGYQRSKSAQHSGFQPDLFASSGGPGGGLDIPDMGTQQQPQGMSPQDPNAQFGDGLNDQGYPSHLMPSQPIMPGSSAFPGLNFDNIFGNEHWG